MGKLNNPRYASGVKENYVYLPSIESQQEIDSLKKELEEEKSKPPVEIVKTSEKIIYKDDPELLERYNSAMKELGKYKVSEREKPNIRPYEVIVEKLVDKIEYINVDRFVLDKKKAIVFSAVSFIVGVLFTLIVF